MYNKVMDNTPNDNSNLLSDPQNTVDKIGSIDGIVGDGVSKVTDQVELRTGQAEQVIQTGIDAVENTVNKTVDTIDSALNAFDRLFK